MLTLVDVILGGFPVGARELIRPTQEAKEFERSINRNIATGTEPFIRLVQVLLGSQTSWST